jgi:hypothetical protein
MLTLCNTYTIKYTIFFAIASAYNSITLLAKAWTLAKVRSDKGSPRELILTLNTTAPEKAAAPIIKNTFLFIKNWF